MLKINLEMVVIVFFVLFLNANGENDWEKKDAFKNKVIGQFLVFWSEWFVVIGLQMCKRSSRSRHLSMKILPLRAMFTARVKSGPEQHQQTLMQCTHTDK